MPKTYLDFDLLIERVGAGYRARVLDSPSGEATAEFGLPFSALELENFILRITRSLGDVRRRVRRLESPERQLVRDFGSRLFQAVFTGAVQDVLQSSLNEAYQMDAGLRVRLHLTDTPELADVPWEFLYNPASNQPLGLSPDTPIVRYLDLPLAPRALAVTLPIRVLVMISSPTDFSRLDVVAEWDRINLALHDLIERGLVSLTRLQSASLASLQKPLRLSQYHILHFVGHGGFDEQSQDGALVLEDGRGLARLVSGQDLGVMLCDHHSLRLIVLNACEGARGSASDPFSGVARRLVHQGIPAVIAMQFEITDEAALTFTEELYTAIADSYPVDTALGEARRAIFASGNDVEWATPVLYMRSPNGQLFRVTHRSATGEPVNQEGAERKQTGPLRKKPPERETGEVAERVGAAAAPPQAPAEIAEARTSPAPWLRRRLVWVGAVLVVVVVAGLTIARFAGPSASHSDTTVTTGIPPTSPPAQTTAASAAVGAAGAGTGAAANVGSQGTASLSDPTQGFDLAGGRAVAFTQSSMAWDGNALSIFDDTTLGAVKLGRVGFEEVGLVMLRSLRYGRGSANPPLGPSDIPVGAVLAVHVEATTFAKLQILKYDTNGALEFRWVTYRAAP